MHFFIIILSVLVNLLKKDERKAVKEIFRIFQPDLMRFIKAKLAGNVSLSEEIFQDTALAFLKIVSQKRNYFKNDNKIKNYLFTIAINKIRDNYRKNQIVKKAEKYFSSKEEMEDSLEKLTDTNLNPEEVALSNDEKVRMNNIVGCTMDLLSRQHREILKLKFIDNKSNVDISKSLNLSIKATESLLFRAKISFKKQFENIALKEEIYKSNNNGGFV